MAIVQGIIKLFYGALRTLRMGIRQNIPVFMQKPFSAPPCNLKGRPTSHTAGPCVAILSMIGVQQKLFLGKQASALPVL